MNRDFVLQVNTFNQNFRLLTELNTIVVWYLNNGWGNIFGSLIMYGIGHIHSKILFRYQIIFLLLGCVTVVVGMIR